MSGDSILGNGGSTRFVTGLSDGTAIITATSQGVTGRLPVMVRERARPAWSVPLDWSFPEAVAPILIGAGVAIGADGTIYVGWNDDPVQTSHWYALSPQGGILWTVDLPGLTKWGMPAIEADGTLYFGASIGSAGSLVAVDPGGSIRWILDGLDAIASSPALGPDGTIHVAGGRHVHAIDPQGEIRWTYETHVRTFFISSPAVASDGTIYVGGNDHSLHAINPDGSPRWTFNTGDLIRAPPSIGADGTIYVPSHDGRLYAVDPDGSERWSVVVTRTPEGFERSRAAVDSPPSIGLDGAIYVLGRGLFAINPDGSIRWHFDSGTSGYRTTPILGADGNVYLGSGVTVTALDAQGRLLWDYQPGGAVFSDVHVFVSPAIGVDGTIIATSVSYTDGGTLHGIVETESANGGYAGSPWPTQRGDRANSGRAGG
ncbi:MAG: PQQ-like beta-propeller repeat protein [Chloroflexi bacterium]|nr:PQQ-like beta-propeller repeat protein [Chloroflexota bacterium]